MKEFHILNLGAGVQSTTLYLMACEGLLRFDYAIFGDTQEEPVDPGVSVYDHLQWLKSLGGPAILERTAGKLGDHLKTGTNSTGQRFASIPAFTLKADGKVSKVRRQCTKEYKIEVIEKAIRRDVLGLKYRQHIKRGTVIHQYIGISLDEVSRANKMKKRQLEKPVPWARFNFPLIDQAWTREDCRAWLKNRVPHRVPRSACVFCPFHDNEEWQAIKIRNGADWKRAVEIDYALREPGNVVNRNMDCKMFLHRSCKPLDQIDFTSQKTSSDDMRQECLGMCGS